MSKNITQALILSQIEDFVREHDRVPTTNEIDTLPNFPTLKTVQRKFSMPYMDIIRMYFPDYASSNKKETKYNKLSNEDLINIFKEQYIRLQCPTMYDYNINRDKGTPRTDYLMQRLKISTYTQLLAKCGLPIKRADHKNNILHPHRTFNVIADNSKPDVRFTDIAEEFYLLMGIEPPESLKKVKKGSDN